MDAVLTIPQVLIYKAKISLMHQGRRLQSVIAPLTPKISARRCLVPSDTDEQVRDQLRRGHKGNGSIQTSRK